MAILTRQREPSLDPLPTVTVRKRKNPYLILLEKNFSHAKCLERSINIFIFFSFIDLNYNEMHCVFNIKLTVKIYFFFIPCDTKMYNACDLPADLWSIITLVVLEGLESHGEKSFAND